MFYAALSIFVFIFNLTNHYFGDWAYIFMIISPITFVAGIAAIILTAVFKLDLKKNFLIYIISIIISTAWFLVCNYYSSFGDFELLAILPIFLLTVQSVVFGIRKAPKSEIAVWILLNPIFGILIFCFIFIFWYVDY